jgi:hypothetical protein
LSITVFTALNLLRFIDLSKKLKIIENNCI